MVTKLQRKLDRLEDLRSDRNDWQPPLEPGSDNAWRPEPNANRSCGRTEAPGTDHAPSTRGSPPRSNPVPPGRSREEERDTWLSANYRRCRDPLCTPVQPKRERHAPERAPLAHGQYRALLDAVPAEDMEWDFEDPDGDPVEDFGISRPQRSASWSRRQREEEQYLEGVC